MERGNKHGAILVGTFFYADAGVDFPPAVLCTVYIKRPIEGRPCVGPGSKQSAGRPLVARGGRKTLDIFCAAHMLLVFSRELTMVRHNGSFLLAPW